MAQVMDFSLKQNFYGFAYILIIFPFQSIYKISRDSDLVATPV